jgi:hypothetical protein
MAKSEIIRCPTCHRKRTRSNPANARYWLLLHKIAEQVKPEGKLYSAEQWHYYFKARNLGCEEFNLPNRKVLQIPKSTADLPTDEFNDYMAKVEHWGIEHNVFLEEME